MSSVSINQISRGPEYIMNFIKKNMDKLNEIYLKGIEEHTKGILSFKCSKKENKMDVYFMNETMICQLMQKDSWEQMYHQTPKEKKLFFVHDLDLNSIFIITV
tara:strand:- start:812 stop:1120 length:309 start_codon:yes stop_codon:yes gene_type:complete